MTSEASVPIELSISKRSKPIKRKTPKGKQAKKPKIETKTRHVGKSGGKKASVQVAAKEKDKVAEIPKNAPSRSDGVTNNDAAETNIPADEEEKEAQEEKEEKDEEMSDDDPSDQDEDNKEDLEDEAKVEQQDPDNETKESKKCYAVTFKGQFNSDGNQFGIFKNECKKPIICSTWDRAQRVKEKTINKYLDKFYDRLIEGRDKIDFTDKIRPEYNAWARKTQFEIRYKYFPGACYCATFDTKDEANDFAKLLNTVQKGEAIRNRFWIRRVCQSYLRLKMRITQGVVMA